MASPACSGSGSSMGTAVLRAPGPDWSAAYGLHAAANAINAEVATIGEEGVDHFNFGLDLYS